MSCPFDNKDDWTVNEASEFWVIIGFEISGLINRNEYGLTWNATTEDGGLALAEEVQLTISAQMIKQG